MTSRGLERTRGEVMFESHFRYRSCTRKKRDEGNRTRKKDVEVIGTHVLRYKGERVRSNKTE